MPSVLAKRNSLLSGESLLCEMPNADLYRFEGTYVLENKETKQISVGIENLLLRGSVLRNTQYIFGVVVYAGHDTKVLLNSSIPRLKKSKVCLF